MTITTNTIINLSGLIIAFGVIFGLIFSIYRWVLKVNNYKIELNNQKKVQEAEIRSIKKEQTVMCYGMLACLDGLKQLGANGNVTKAHETLEKHINQSAHDQEE